jgi:hypothetical protein
VRGKVYEPLPELVEEEVLQVTVILSEMEERRISEHRGCPSTIHGAAPPAASPAADDATTFDATEATPHPEEQQRGLGSATWAGGSTGGLATASSPEPPLPVADLVVAANAIH